MTLPDDHPLKELETELLAPRIVCNGCGKLLDRVGEAHEGHWTAGDRFPDLCGNGVQTALIDPEDATEAIDDFAAAHPGLVDFTTSCHKCGGPVSRRHAMKYVDVVVARDEDFVWERGQPLCPTCAKEET